MLVSIRQHGSCHAPSREIFFCDFRVPIGNQLRQPAMAVTSQQLDAVGGRHVCATRVMSCAAE